MNKYFYQFKDGDNEGAFDMRLVRKWYANKTTNRVEITLTDGLFVWIPLDHKDSFVASFQQL